MHCVIFSTVQNAYPTTMNRHGNALTYTSQKINRLNLIYWNIANYGQLQILDKWLEWRTVLQISRFFFCPIITNILVRNLQIFCPELAFLKLWTLFPSFGFGLGFSNTNWMGGAESAPPVNALLIKRWKKALNIGKSKK